MLRPDNLFQIFGIIILLLMSIGLISYTTKYIFGVGQTKRATKIPDEIYDREHKQNKTQICPFADDSYRVKFEESPCFNKTMLHWYVPWTKHGVWIRFRQKIEERKRTEEMKRRQAEEEARKNTTTIEKKPEEPAAPPENSTNQKVQEKPPKVVYTILAALLVLSSTFACLEVFRGKFRRKDAADVKAEQRRYSLADFTINRHLRRESQQANMQHIQRQASFDHPAKVTPNLVHQGSLDRAISKLNSEVKPAPLTRRSSVPAHLAANPGTAQQMDKDKLRNRNATTSSMGSNKASCDLSGEESSPDMRRKSRHFIRRH